MNIDIEKAKLAKENLKQFLDVNNIMYHYVGLEKEVADWALVVGIDYSVDMNIIPDHVNEVKVYKKHAKPVLQKNK